ncbi:hypothetical protein ABZ119_10500 [Streptomyces sp. NPDC006288]|uniref:hypothetical protein n=1 Tax=Streptomyces sp. NPDC006288 TaxID=3156743 RepID=UPI0033AA7B5A
MKEIAPRLKPATEELTDRARFRSVLSALLFVPAALVLGLLTLTSERAGRCLTYGEGCGSSLPGWLFTWSLGLGAVACVVALQRLRCGYGGLRSLRNSWQRERR